MKLVEKKLNGEEAPRVAEMDDLMDHETKKGKASKKKNFKLGLLAQPLLTPTYLRNLGPLNRYIFFINLK